MHAHRPTIAGTRHMIAAGHYLAATAGFDILQAGGNAIDAGCAAGIALGVVQPDIVNVGGVAPIILYSAEHREIVTIEGLGHWPRSLDPTVFQREHGGTMPSGVRRCVVPAAPDAWITALARYGTMTFGEVATAATRFAREGFVMYPFLADNIKKWAEEYRRYPSNAAIYLPGGRPPETGERFVQSDLAASLQYMADQEKAARGDRLAGLEAARAAFYRGDIAQKIIAFMRAEGGFMTERDLADFRSPVTKPERLDRGDISVFTCGAWCQGPALLQALKLLEGTDLKALGHNSVAYIHRLTEALKLAFADREAYYTDPALGRVPLDRLLSDDYARQRRAAIDPERAWPEMPAPGDLGAAPAARRLVAAGGEPARDRDTSYVCVVDRHGNVFSATPSDSSSQVPVVPGTGLIASSRGSQSRPDPSHPAGVAPGKRPRLTPNPALAIKGGDVFVPFGTPGGDVQTQAMLQTFVNLFEFGMDVQAAIEAPRFATYSYPSSFAPYEYYPGRLNLEGRIDKATGDQLAAMGHKVTWWPEWNWLAGAMCAIVADRKTGLMRGGADPRRASYAIGW
jgi:gamma-glutamyltranspeptidase/glutathione hydrolase